MKTENLEKVDSFCCICYTFHTYLIEIESFKFLVNVLATYCIKIWLILMPKGCVFKPGRRNNWNMQLSNYCLVYSICIILENFLFVLTNKRKLTSWVFIGFSEINIWVFTDSLVSSICLRDNYVLCSQYMGPFKKKFTYFVCIKVINPFAWFVMFMIMLFWRCWRGVMVESFGGTLGVLFPTIELLLYFNYIIFLWIYIWSFHLLCFLILFLITKLVWNLKAIEHLIYDFFEVQIIM